MATIKDIAEISEKLSKRQCFRVFLNNDPTLSVPKENKTTCP